MGPLARSFRDSPMAVRLTNGANVRLGPGKRLTISDEQRPGEPQSRGIRCGKVDQTEGATPSRAYPYSL